jgi:hypothetical protein
VLTADVWRFFYHVSACIHACRAALPDSCPLSFGQTACYAPCTESDCRRGPWLMRFPCAGNPRPDAERQFVDAFQGLELEGAFLDCAGGAAAGDALLRAGAARAVVAWPSAPPPPVLPALDFAHCFFGLLRDPHASVPEVGAFAACRGAACGRVGCRQRRGMG